MIHIQLVKPGTEGEQWARFCQPLIAKPLEHQNMIREYPLEWLIDEIKEGKHQLWIVWRNNKIVAVLTGCFAEYPSGDMYYEIFTVGGWKIEEWSKQFIDAAIKFAKANGCHRLVGGGRPGWQRYMKKILPGVETHSTWAYDLEEAA